MVFIRSTSGFPALNFIPQTLVKASVNAHRADELLVAPNRVNTFRNVLNRYSALISKGTLREHQKMI